MELRFFELRVSRGEAPRSYRLFAASSHHGDGEAVSTIEPSAPPFETLPDLLMQPRTLQDLRTLGTALFASVFLGKIDEAFQNSLQEVLAGDGLSLRITLRIEPPELAVLPWETLFDPRRELFLAAAPKVSLSRTLTFVGPIRPMTLPLEARALVVVPDSGLETDRERSETESLLRQVMAVDGVTGKVTRARLLAALQEREYHLIHFSGHGAFRDGEAMIYLDGERGIPDLVPAQVFADFFLHDSSARLVLLNSCQGAMTSYEALTGLAPELLRRGVPAVVAMQSSITNSEATRFAAAFYQSLIRGPQSGNVDVALARARGALLQDGFFDTGLVSPIFASPVLYLRSRESQLWHPGAAELLTPALIAPVLERLQSRFSESIRHHLAGGQLIRRKETRELLAQLNEETTRIVVVHGIAGSGKSGVLFELAEDLTSRGVPFLPLRLDRHRLEGDPESFGSEALGLPSSPARCLAALSIEKGAVLLLDQLDALRWTSAHSSEAWDVCREMIAEALMSGLKVVVCCRTFDLKHDPQLRGWEQEIKNLRRVEVQQLSSAEVTAAIQRASEGRGGVPALRPKEQDLLCQIHHLQMWLAIYKSTESAPAFDTAWSLMRQFWASRYDELAKEGVRKERAEELEGRLVKAMEKGATLTSRVRKLDMAQSELELYQRHHLIQVDPGGNTFTFCHQSYQDYLIAKHLLGELDQCRSEEVGRRVATWLGDREKQSLFRREQLRLLLGALRDEEHESYIPTLREFLTAEQPAPESLIRFHLRLLVLQSLGQVIDPRPEEVHLVLALLDQPFWREHVLGEVARGQVPWFEVLDDQRKLEAWLAGEDPRLQELALDMMLYVVEKCGDRVARLLAPYLEKDETWTRRILWVLRFEPSQDSDALFDVRLRLAKEGSYVADHVEWSKLAQSRPDRFILLVAYVLMAYAVSISQGESRRRPGSRTEIDWHSLEKVSSEVIPRPLWATAWKMIFRTVSLVVQVQRYPREPPYILESLAADFDTLKPVLRLLKDLGRALLAESWSDLTTLGEELSRVGRRTEVLFLDTLVEGPAVQEFADWALAWLMADPWRARLRLRNGSGVWSLSRKLIERYASVCSPETYDRLEHWLLSYREPDLLDRYKFRRGLSEPSVYGRTPYALLPKLPVERCSAEVTSRIGELSRKFLHPSSSDEEDDEDTLGGWVGSPLSEEAKERMSDEDWLAIAANKKIPARGGKWRFKDSGHIEESSIETFATDLRSMTQRQPERFARLALRLPPNAHPEFLNAILSGLGWAEDRHPIEGWAPPSHTALEDLLALPAVQARARGEDKEAAKSLCSILGRYSKYAWSEDALDLLVWIAKHHKDPEQGYYPVGSSGGDSEHFDQLEINALNVTRGSAGYTIRNLLFAQPTILASLRPALKSLIRDGHPAVRVAAIAACLPVINIDRDLAVDWFVQACEGTDALLGTREARDFLRYTYRTHLDKLRPLIERMVDSPLPRVAVAGAVQVAACFLVLRELEEQFERCLGGTPPQRKGIAKVAAELLGDARLADQAKTTLLRLAGDENKQVAQVVARSFEHLDLRHITSDRETWNEFARSKAFQIDPSYLLRALDRQSGKLLPFADCLLIVGTTFAEELAEASQNMATRISGDTRELLPLLLRLYEQAKEEDQDLYLRCLDLWDRLLERRVGAAMGLTKELDRMA